jgi:hypothetical protein
MKISILVGGRFHAFDLAEQLQKHNYLHQLVTSYPRWKVLKSFNIEKGRIKTVVLKEYIERFIIITAVGSTETIRFEITLDGTNTKSFTTIGTYFKAWYNITWTISTIGAWTIYINNAIPSGISSGQPNRTIIQIPVISDRTYCIGKSSYTIDGKLNMYLDDFRIYGKELTATEVSELYTGRVEVYNKNNIGIGTTNPNTNYILDVNGNANVNGAITTTGTLTSSSTIRGTTVNCCDSGIITAAMGRLFNIVGANAVMRIWRDNGVNSPGMEFMSGTISSGSSYTKFWDMGIGGSTGDNYFYIRDRKPPSRFLNRIIHMDYQILKILALLLIKQNYVP